LWDLEERTERILPFPSDNLNSLAISPDAGFVVAGTRDSEVYVLHLDSDEPHLLSGHDSVVSAIWISPDSREIRTAGTDGLVLCWDIPTGKSMHAVPHTEFVQFLQAQTNMRVILDNDAVGGYRIEYDRFPGWETSPPR
jgi:WD40 repeat protein